MQILYAAAIRLPTEKAHGAQIMHTCEALADAGAEVTLAVPGRATDIKEDPFAYYRIEENFSLEALRVPDWFSRGRLGIFYLDSAFCKTCRKTCAAYKARGDIFPRQNASVCALNFPAAREACVGGAWPRTSVGNQAPCLQNRT